MTTGTLDDLELSVRAGNVLRRAGITTLDQFLALNRETVLAMNNAGRRTWNEINEIQRAIAPTENDLRRDRERKILHAAGYLNMLLDTDPSLGVRVVENRIEVMRKLDD